MFKDLQEDIDKAKVLTEDLINDFSTSEYESGRELTEGDKAVFGLFVKNENGYHLTHDELKENLEEVENYGVNLHIGLFHPDEIGELYEAVKPESLGDEYYMIFSKDPKCGCGGQCGCGGHNG